MRKTLLLCLLACCLALTGCSAGPMITAGSDATPYDQMPATPSGLTLQKPSGFEATQVADNIIEYYVGEQKIVCEYAIVPAAVATLQTATAEKNLPNFAKQYAVGLSSGYTVTEKSLFEAPGFLISGTLEEDTDHGKAEEAAIYAVLPYGEYFVMLYAFAPAVEADSLAANVDALIGGFTAA